MTWSANRLAARAVALHAHSPAEARELLDMLGILDGDRIAPDDRRVYGLPTLDSPRDGEDNLTRRDKAARAPAGLTDYDARAAS